MKPGMMSTTERTVPRPSGNFAYLEKIKLAEHLLRVRPGARPFIYAW